MRGSVKPYETKAGRRWAVVYDLPPDPDGNRRQAFRRGFTTRREAQAALRRALVAAEEGRHVDHSTQTLAAYLRSWLAGVAVKATTLDNYRVCAEAYVIPRLGGVALQQLTAEHLDSLYRELERSGRRRDGGPLAAKSVRHVHTMLHRALQTAVERSHVARNVADLAHPPTRTATRSKAARDKAWTPEQVRAFLSVVEADRLYALWQLFATTGLRRGEALALRWADVSLDGGRLRVARTVTVADKRALWSDDGKTRTAERTIALDTSTVATLRAHRARQLEERMAAGPSWRDHDLVFCWPDGRPIHPDRVSTWFLRNCRSLQLPEIGPHGLRHSYATAALLAGVAPHIVSKRLGHADVATTLSIYSHVFVGDDETAAEVAAQAILGS